MKYSKTVLKNCIYKTLKVNEMYLLLISVKLYKRFFLTCMFEPFVYFDIGTRNSVLMS